MKRIHEYSFLVSMAGDDWRVRLYGAPRGDGIWAGFFVFLPETGEQPRRTGVETEQTSAEALLYWAGGVTPTYLEGAFHRSFGVAVDRDADSAVGP